MGTASRNYVILSLNLSDVGLILVFAVIIQSLKAICMKRLGSVIGSEILKLQPEKRRKFAKNFWQLLCRSFSLVVELYLLIPSDFWISIWNPFNKQYGTSLFWTNVNESPPFGIRLFLFFKIGFFGSDLMYFILISGPKKRVDFIMYCVHHIFMCVLILLSYSAPPAWKICSGILLIQEVSEVAIRVCITLRDLGYELIPDILNAINILVTIITKIIWTARICVSLYIDGEGREGSYYLKATYSILAWTLYTFQIYWTYTYLLRFFWMEIIPKYKPIKSKTE